jgi:hypothetical protein
LPPQVRREAAYVSKIQRARNLPHGESALGGGMAELFAPGWSGVTGAQP